VARRAGRGLGQALAGSEPAPAGRARPPRRTRAANAGIGVATLALCIASVVSINARPGLSLEFLGHPPLSTGQILLALAVVVPLPLAARYPMLGWRIGWLELLLAPLVHGYWWGGWPWGPVQVAALLAAFCVAGVRQQRPVLWWMWALTLIPWWLWLARDLPDLGGPFGATFVFTAVTIAVDSVSSRLRAQQALDAQTERTGLEQARRAVLEERARIARELHDVVAHHMSLIAVRAETAPYRLSGLPEPVRAEFGSLSEAAREALTDMRRLLGVLRDDQPAGRAPQPQLSDLPILVDTARQAGVLVELTVAAALHQVPAGVGVCAYRIVQESLSNASQHAPGAAVTVSVGNGASAVLLRIANGPGRAAASGGADGVGAADGVGGPAGNGRRPGQGLAGMRERVALLGGSLSAGPAPGGGFVVSAVLPLGAAA
jgi:signal transduction histidine kinase